MHSALHIEICKLVDAMECSTFVCTGDAVSRNKRGTGLAAIALTWYTLDDFFLWLLKFDLHKC